jgi:hypothetical protein
MDPYTKSVIDTSLPIMQQELGKTLASNAGNAVNQGAFGGSRFGVQQGTAQAQGALGMANMAAGLNQANFNQAQAAATGDINRQFDVGKTNQLSQQTDLARSLEAQKSNQSAQQQKINSDIQAASGLNTSATNAGQLAQSAFNMQNTAGNMQMAQARDQIAAQMAKFNEANNYGTKQMGILQSALGMTPYGQTTTGQKETETYTPTDWASLAGAGLGAAGSIFHGAGTSDKRIKKNLKLVAKDDETGIPVYDYNWKGEPAGSPKTRGPMAQDVEKVMPGAVVEDPSGVKHVKLGVLGALSRVGPTGTRGALAHGQGGLVPMSGRAHRQRSRPPQIRGALGG